jgi:predicted nucleotidyltransferase
VARSALESLAAILDRLGIQWVLFGALAANLYRGETRLTGDTDLLLADAGRDRALLDDALAEAGWKRFSATPDGSLLRLRHADLGIVDLIMAGTVYERIAIDRSRLETLRDGVSVRALTPEDVVVFKLIAGRSKDLADIESILLTGRALDERHIERWAAEWDVLDRWRALRTAT